MLSFYPFIVVALLHWIIIIYVYRIRTAGVLNYCKQMTNRVHRQHSIGIAITWCRDSHLHVHSAQLSAYDRRHSSIYYSICVHHSALPLVTLHLNCIHILDQHSRVCACFFSASSSLRCSWVIMNAPLESLVLSFKSMQWIYMHMHKCHFTLANHLFCRLFIFVFFVFVFWNWNDWKQKIHKDRHRLY